MKPGQKPTGRYQLLMGPWYHLTAGDGFSIYPLELRWFDHWLKGRNTGIDRVKSPLHVYETGADRWLDAKRYPLHSARRTPSYPRATTFYLDGGPSDSNAVSTNDGTLRRQPSKAAAASDRIAFVGAASPCARQSDQWSGGAVAYKGISVSGFPNWFILMGPNTGPGHTSVLIYTEAQIEHLLGAIRVLRRDGLKYVEVRREVQERYDAGIQRRMKHMVWSSGCTSWYLSADGSNRSLYPGFAAEYALRTRRFAPRDYERVGFGSRRP